MIYDNIYNSSIMSIEVGEFPSPGLKDQEVSCSRLLQAAEENLARVNGYELESL